ncbi:hypothetical protein J2S08_002557, partial [Bacillus chungangensis]|nr:hypothetical protein [Bacillus chungangensis]
FVGVLEMVTDLIKPKNCLCCFIFTSVFSFGSISKNITEKLHKKKHSCNETRYCGDEE